MKNSSFIAGVVNKYPAELLENRLSQEGNIVGVLWAQPSLLADYSLEASDFITREGRFYFGVARMLRNDHGLNDFDEAAVITHLTPELMDRFNEFGGYKAIDNIRSVSNPKNAEAYVDELNKANLFLRLHESGFPVTSEVDDGQGRKVVPFEYCKKFDSQSTSEFYDALLSRMAKKNGCSSSSIIEVKEEFTITDGMLDNLNKGQLVGSSIGYFDESDLDMRGKRIRVTPFLDNEICGIRPKTTTALIGYSSTGKTMLVCEWLLALCSNGHKVCIISNEMDSIPYYLNFICFLAFRKFRYLNLTRSKLQSGNLNDADKECLEKVKKYFNDNFSKSIVFYQITDAATEVVKKLYRHAVLELGCDCVFYDTMKADLSEYNSNQPAYLSLIRDARTIDALAKKYNTISMVSLQISSATKGRCWLDESVISNSKQVVEVFETCLMLRNCYGKSELQAGEKNYINPFRIVPNNDPNSKSKWKREQVLLDPDASYKILFITKNRAGKNSESSGDCILLKAEAHLATFHEECYCRPTRGYIGANDR